MSKQLDRHNIDKSLYIFKQSNSKKWYARFMLFGKWYCKSTTEEDKELAIDRSRFIRMEWKIKLEKGELELTKRFRDVAQKAIDKMQDEIDREVAKVVFKDYIGALKKYHIPYFDRTFITSIDQQKLADFDVWREKTVGRRLTTSTLQNHNAALQRVFTEAVDNKWMTVHQIPNITARGEAGSRRAAFTEDEYYKIVETIEKMRDESRKEKTRQIRELLLTYIEFVIHTGIRPGTEMESLTWGDIGVTRQGHQAIFKIKVRKGKTTKHTGTRTVVCKDEIYFALTELQERFPDRKPTDKLFRLADGSPTKELGRTFSAALTEAGLKSATEKSKNSDEKQEVLEEPRSLYSLRHTYITWQLLSKELRIDILARQCGTSTAMIEQHYSHVVPSMFEEELSGVKLEKSKQRKRRIGNKSRKASLAEEFKQLEANYQRRGCI